MRECSIRFVVRGIVPWLLLAGCGSSTGTGGSEGTPDAQGDLTFPAADGQADAPLPDIVVADIALNDGVGLDTTPQDASADGASGDSDAKDNCNLAACPADACRDAICKADGTCGLGPSKTCDDSNPCTADYCDSALGCQHANAGESCDDGNACTTGDACKSGACTAAGALDCDDSNLCTSDSCNPSSGCAHVNNTVPCDDGNACTLVDVCLNGICTNALLATCADGNPCTDDTCNPQSGCVFLPNTATCTDNNACTLGDTCAGAVCKPAAPSDCDDGNPCTTETCDTMGGCSSSNNTAPCADGSVCTQNDLCAGGVCVAGASIGCSDGNPCTDDSCDATAGCVHAANTADCTDENTCTVGDACQNAGCVPGSAKVCDDGNACTTDSCNPLSGCQASNSTLACSDGNVCTGGDVCAEGKCVAGPSIGCNDGNPCTDDSCDPTAGCVFKANSAPCDDKNGCTSGDICAAGACTAGTTGCSDAATCVPQTTGVQCVCIKGYAGDGFTCSDIDECAISPSVCQTNTSCSNTQGSYECLCNSGYFDCDNNLTNGCETNIYTDATNCGKCGSACSNNNILMPSCAAGVCNGQCTTGFSDCDGNKRDNGCEQDTTSDVNNCDSCGTICSPVVGANPTCIKSVCGSQCMEGHSDCDNNLPINGCETNVATDPNNCGGCGMACSNLHIVTPACTAKMCSGKCATGWADCNANKGSDGCEVDLTSDKKNCNACGQACALGQNCVASVCQ